VISLKRYIIFFTVLLFVTGCHANYNLTIDDSFKENLSVTESDSRNYNHVLNGFTLPGYRDYYLTKEFPYHYNDPYMVETNYKFDNVSYYDAKDLSNNGQIGLSLSADFKDIDSFSNSNIVWKTCKNKNISLNNNVLKISVSGFNYIGDYDILDSVTVNINSDYKVISSNADKVSGNKYSWIIDKDNYISKTISISFNTASVFENAASDIKDDSMIKFTIVLCIIVTICFIIYFVVKNIFARRNRI